MEFNIAILNIVQYHLVYLGDGIKPTTPTDSESTIVHQVNISLTGGIGKSIVTLKMTQTRIIQTTWIEDGLSG